MTSFSDIGRAGLEKKTVSSRQHSWNRTPQRINAATWAIKAASTLIKPQKPPMKYPKALAMVWIVTMVVKLAPRESGSLTWIT